MGIANVARKEHRQCYCQPPHHTNLEDAIVFIEKNGYSHTATTKKNENERSQHFTDKVFHHSYSLVSTAKIAIILELSATLLSDF
jgi:hypothetical protein